MMPVQKQFYSVLLSLFFSVVSISEADAQNRVRVTKIIDGDTFLGKTSGREIKFRLIGVDAPETRNSSKKRKHPFGPLAKKCLAKLMPVGTDVLIQYDVSSKDRYQRDLVYVFSSDRQLINAELVSQGCATVLTMPPNVTYAEEFLRRERQARQAKRGLWGYFRGMSNSQ